MNGQCATYAQEADVEHADTGVFAAGTNHFFHSAAMNDQNNQKMNFSENLDQITIS